MKKFLLGAAGLVAAMSMTAQAGAADLAARPYTKAPPAMIPALYDWSGFYIGLNGGGGDAHKCWTNVNTLGVPTIPGFAEGCHDATGGMAGGQIGYRWQSAAWVFGVEAQGDWANFKGSNASLASAPLFGFGVTNRTRVNSLGLFTGQVGYAWNNVLWYVKGGAAVVDERYTGIVTATNVTFDQANDTRWGGTVGTGVEVSFAPNWSVAFEYDHLFMGSHNVSLTSTVTGALSRIDSIKQDVDIGTVRVNYRWGGPVIAKY
jgi:outer membrane immunogenic protein